MVAIQRQPDQRFWAGDKSWVRESNNARLFHSDKEAVVTFVMENNGPLTMFNPVKVEDLS